MSMGSPKSFMLNDNKPAAYIQQLDQVIDMKLAIVMIVIPSNKVELFKCKILIFNNDVQGDHFAAVKKCCIEKPIPSQCVTTTVLSKPKGLMSVGNKVAIQASSWEGSHGLLRFP